MKESCPCMNSVANCQSDGGVCLAPPLGAGAESATVPVLALPPTTLLGFSDSVASTGGGVGFTVIVVVLVTPS